MSLSHISHFDTIQNHSYTQQNRHLLNFEVLQFSKFWIGYFLNINCSLRRNTLQILPLKNFYCHNDEFLQMRCPDKILCNLAAE